MAGWGPEDYDDFIQAQTFTSTGPAGMDSLIIGAKMKNTAVQRIKISNNETTKKDK